MSSAPRRDPFLSALPPGSASTSSALPSAAFPADRRAETDDVLDQAGFKDLVDAALRRVLSSDGPSARSPYLRPLIEVLREFVDAGGKRLRPLLCYYGWRAAGGSGEPEALVQVAAALELFHTFALVHDDVMDASERRRGQPTVHRALAAAFRRGIDADATEAFGVRGAILLGDLALIWSGEILSTAPLPPDRYQAVTSMFAAMRGEVLFGEYLDLRSDTDADDDLAAALRVIHYKTATYTVQRPLQIGAALAGADADFLDRCRAFALPLGAAFQLRDDILGAFGDPARTGKSNLDDLRGGKHTALLAIALRDGDPGQRARLRRLVGDPALDESGAEEVRSLLTATGALAAVEEMIAERRDQALAVLDGAPFDPALVRTLSGLARAATDRAS